MKEERAGERAALTTAVERVLRPLVRTAIARGLLHPALADMLKTLYVEEAEAHFALDGKRLTDSRVSLLTGLQRKDVRSLRERATRTDKTGANPLARVVARWLAGPPYGVPGEPSPLPRTADTGGASFESLVAAISRDIHPRTVLDEFLRLGIARHDPADDRVTLEAAALVPSHDEDALLGYFGANLGDHAEAAAANLAVAPAPGPHFERAVHYNRLRPVSLQRLEGLARRLESDVLLRLNAEASALQRADADAPDATGRFRCGAFVYVRNDEPGEPET